MNYPNKTYCKECKETTEHRPKMDAVKNGNLVCNECDTQNPFRFPSETPDRWSIVKIDNKETFYKVFGSWAGGYLDGDRWRMNSGIARVEEDLENYYFYGHSGSCYKCHKRGYGVATSYSQSVLNGMLENAKELEVDMEILDDREDWTKLKIN